MNQFQTTPIEVYRAPTHQQCREQALVLRSIGLPFQILQHAEGFGVFVEAPMAQRALEELRSYQTENVDWPPPKDRPEILSNGRLGALAYALLIGFMHPFILKGPVGLDWWNAGMNKGAAVRSGEVWRTVTAMTLHADFAHLIGNLTFGVAYGIIASTSLGSGLPWLLAVMAGAFANGTNVMLKGPGFSSIGASTAVFALLGILTAFEWMRRHILQLPLARRLGPLIGGALLVGFLGVGDPAQKTDIGGHVFGLLYGALFGALAGWLRLPDRLTARGQQICAVLAFSMIAIAWAFAAR